MTHELAQRAWLVKINLRLDEQREETRFLASAAPNAAAAASNLDRLPGIVATDARAIVRELGAKEIAALKLRPDAVRPFIVPASCDRRAR